MAGGGGGGDGEPEFQIAPMIDVLLVLLVFFVTITSSEVLKVDKLLKLPISKNAKPRDPELSKQEMAVNVRLDKATNKGTLVINDKVFTNWSEAVPLLENANKIVQNENGGKQIRIVIRADENLPASEVQRVISVVAEAGIPDISFAASNK